jgi:hypothetical protein
VTGGGSGSGETNCSDGLDNEGDRAIDCGDSDCSSSPQCANLQDGKPCLLDSQCAGAKCLTEATTGIANGACSNATSCTLGTNAGCNGGRCFQGATSNTCLASCAGTGAGVNGCRAGFICYDPDTNTTNNNNVCLAGCANTSECSGSGSGYGCNPWSKRCGNLDQGLRKYGATCTSDSQCETGICLSGPDYPAGYCAGVCRGDTSNCANGGFCSYSASFGDNLGYCFQSCLGSDTECLNPFMSCFRTSPGAPTRACYCFSTGNACAIDDDCCSGWCDFFFSVCN